MIGLVTRSTAPNLMDPKADWEAILTEAMLDRPEMVCKRYAKHRKTNRKQVKFTGITGLGPLVQSNEYGDPNWDTPMATYDKTVTPNGYNLFSMISREAWDDDQTGELRKYAQWFADSYNETIETTVANLLNTGFDTATSPDGSYFFATDHSMMDYSDQANTPSVAADLTESSLRQGFIDMRSLRDHRGKHARVKPRYLMVPPELEFEAMTILQSDKRSGTADNDVNVFRKHTLNIIVNEYLTDSDAWFLIWDKVQSDMNPIQIVERQKLETDLEEVFLKSGAKMCRAYCRFAAAVIGWIGYYGSPGA